MDVIVEGGRAANSDPGLSGPGKVAWRGFCPAALRPQEEGLARVAGLQAATVRPG